MSACILLQTTDAICIPRALVASLQLEKDIVVSYLSEGTMNSVYLDSDLTGMIVAMEHGSATSLTDFLREQSVFISKRFATIFTFVTCTGAGLIRL